MSALPEAIASRFACDPMRGTPDAAGWSPVWDGEEEVEVPIPAELAATPEAAVRLAAFLASREAEAFRRGVEGGKLVLARELRRLLGLL